MTWISCLTFSKLAISPVLIRISIENATAGRISDAGADSPNLLLYTGFIGTGPPPVDDPPVARFSWTCTDVTCVLDGTGSTDDNGIVSYFWDLDRFPDPTASGP